MDKVKIELDREFAKDVHEVLGCMNFYMVGATVCRSDRDLTDEDVERYVRSCGRAYAALDRALSDAENCTEESCNNCRHVCIGDDGNYKTETCPKWEPKEGAEA